MKKLLFIPFLLLSIAAYSQMNTFGGIGLRVNDTTTYQTNAADFHTAGYYDIYFNNQATNDHWDIWNGSSYDHIFAFGQGSGAVTSVFSRTGVVVAATSDYDAVQVDNTPAGGIAATNAQAAINELDTEKAASANTSSAITDAASMDITGPKHTLTTSSATRTFTQSWTGDFTSIIVTLSATTSTFTFPAGALCVSDGVASGNNTAALAGVSGDKYYISISKYGTDYYVVIKNFGQ